ncbi:uncharacterized protein RJT21DRAFT_132597 [Scheffersomyces amazonensis]|uniref:uncharacterized protein n=1 Tax=Scheffersomyces amazonensis TaxID=1078765 RepID=UPI00315C7196
MMLKYSISQLISWKHSDKLDIHLQDLQLTKGNGNRNRKVTANNSSSTPIPSLNSNNYGNSNTRKNYTSNSSGPWNKNGLNHYPQVIHNHKVRNRSSSTKDQNRVFSTNEYRSGSGPEYDTYIQRSFSSNHYNYNNKRRNKSINRSNSYNQSNYRKDPLKDDITTTTTTTKLTKEISNGTFIYVPVDTKYTLVHIPPDVPIPSSAIPLGILPKYVSSYNHLNPTNKENKQLSAMDQVRKEFKQKLIESAKVLIHNKDETDHKSKSVKFVYNPKKPANKENPYSTTGFFPLSVLRNRSDLSTTTLSLSGEGNDLSETESYSQSTIGSSSYDIQIQLPNN